MKIKLLRGLWRVALRLRAFWVLEHLRCVGTAPADCWIDDPEGGYYRGGILRRYCERFRGHRGRCLAPISALGHERRGGVEFDPEPRREFEG